jgi:ABC-type Na+ efflux pump permease subunit
MHLRRIWAVTRKETNHIIRDRSTLFLVLLTPTLLLLLMAYALTVDIQHVALAVVDYDRSPTSRSFVQQITAGDDLDLYAQVGSLSEVEQLLLRGEIKAASLSTGLSLIVEALQWNTSPQELRSSLIRL